MFDNVLDMDQDHLNCFAVVLREIQGKVDICQTDDSIHSKQRICPYPNVIHGSIDNIQANERLTRVKEKQSSIKWRRLNNTTYLTYLQYTDLAKADYQRRFIN